jgi:DNA-directed RNA polymerase specialized sigma subunit
MHIQRTKIYTVIIKERQMCCEQNANFVLPACERVVITALGQGKSLAEIGKQMGISKQAVQKISRLALSKLKDRLSGLGYRRLDSKGFLKSSETTVKRRSS